MHGGLSPGLLEAKSLDILDKISRPLPDNRISADGNQLATDLLWADPDINVRLFSSSNRRGIGRMFGQEVIDRVRQRFGIDLIVRAHQVVLDGHEFFNDDASSGLITLFTAPHYCGQSFQIGMTIRERLCEWLRIWVSHSRCSSLSFKTTTRLDDQKEVNDVQGCV
uniref:protein-serine/threonine phosphatase n=1 Tax=Meloidogyne javanica TaxID=6303 RepID=A0A915LDN8_MELJA